MHQKPLLYDVLRSQELDQLTKKLQGASLKLAGLQTTEREDSDDELVSVQSIPGTPLRSSASSRASSPTRASTRRLPGPLLLPASKIISSDPLRAFPTEVGQCIFRQLAVSDLVSCSRVCKKWSKSQTLNYVWFQHYRKDNFHDTVLPNGKWTRRESKQNWRQSFMRMLANRECSPILQSSSLSLSPGTQTPREAREEQWRSEAEFKQRPEKTALREMYKELGGRKVKSKGRLPAGVGGGGSRDRGGWDGGIIEDW